MAVNIHDYSKTSAQKGWGAGWPACSGASGDMATVATPSGVRFSVRKRVARLVDILIDETERRGYRFYREQCGSFNCRPIGKTNRPSNHSWGLAVDINWSRNPMRRPYTSDMPGWMPPLWKRYGFAHGGDYSGTPDTMHYEFMGTPVDADEMTDLAVREILHRQPPAPPKPKRVIGDDEMKWEMPHKLVQVERADGSAEFVRDFARDTKGEIILGLGDEICPAGRVSAVASAAYVSIKAITRNGEPGKAFVWIGDDAFKAGDQPPTLSWAHLHGAEFPLPHGVRCYFPIPDGSDGLTWYFALPSVYDVLISRVEFIPK